MNRTKVALTGTLSVLLLFSRTQIVSSEESLPTARVISLGGAEFKLGGIIQAWYQTKQDSQSDFLIKHLRLMATGDISPKVSFNLMPAFASPSGVNLLNGFIDIKPIDHLSFRAGQFVFPFGQNRMMPVQNLELANYQLNGKVFPGIISDLGWDIGAQAAATFKYLDARVAVINGAGPNVVRDTDTVKDVSARVEIYPLGNKKVIGGASYYSGRSHGNGTVNPLFGDLRNWWGGHTKLTVVDAQENKVILHGEIISRSDANRLWVIQGSYKFKAWKYWQLVSDWERFDPETGHHTRRVTGGLNFWVDSRCRITLNVFNDDDGRTSVNNFVSQVQVEF